MSRIPITPEVVFHINEKEPDNKYIVQVGRMLIYFTNCQQWALTEAQRYNNNKHWYQLKARVIAGKKAERTLMKTELFNKRDVLGQ